MYASVLWIIHVCFKLIVHIYHKGSWCVTPIFMHGVMHNKLGYFEGMDYIKTFQIRFLGRMNEWMRRWWRWWYYQWRHRWSSVTSYYHQHHHPVIDPIEFSVINLLLWCLVTYCSKGKYIHTYHRLLKNYCSDSVCSVGLDDIYVKAQLSGTNLFNIHGTLPSVVYISNKNRIMGR